MSGGHFEYKCFEIVLFAEELDREIQANDDTTVDDWGDTLGNRFEEPTISRLKTSLQIIGLAGRLAKEVEWLYSGDHGEESFNDLFDEIMVDKFIGGDTDG